MGEAFAAVGALERLLAAVNPDVLLFQGGTFENQSTLRNKTLASLMARRRMKQSKCGRRIVFTLR